MEKNPAHLCEVRTNSSMIMEQDAVSFVPIVELILIGYRSDYHLNTNPAEKSAVTKVMEASTSRTLLTLTSAKLLHATLEKVVAHLETMNEVTESISEAISQATQDQQ